MAEQIYSFVAVHPDQFLDIGSTAASHYVFIFFSSTGT